MRRQIQRVGEALRRLAPVVFAALATCLIASPGLAQPSGGEQPRELRLLIVTTDFVLPGKLDKVARIAAAERVTVSSLRLGAAPKQAARLDDVDLVILDTPRPNDLARVQGEVGAALAASSVAWIRIGGGPPAFGNLPPEQARRLIGYYAGGGESNLRQLAAYARTWKAGGDLKAFPEPSRIGATGIYHPDAPGSFASLEAYLAWGKDRWAAGAPRLAYVIHSGLISGMETRTIDAFIRHAESAGAMPLVFWFEAAKADGLTSVLKPAQADLLVIGTHLQNGAARAAEFRELGIPAIQTTGFRGGNAEAFEEAKSGLSMQMVAPFLAVPESWGASDPIVIEALEGGELAPLPRQMDALVAKALKLTVLRRKPAAEKTLALMFWNYPPGEKNLSASGLNLPRSLEALTAALAKAGYDVPATAEASLTASAQAMLGAVYHPERASALLAEGLAVTLPLARYEQWFDTLPLDRQIEVTRHWGEPANHAALREVDGEKVFVLPRLRLGKLAIMPQLPRDGVPGGHYHDSKLAPDHLYLAQYLYLREASGADALIHFGTHGTQEWTPGKDRGLSVDDFPYLTLGDLPVFYPYIQDNVGEAVQARRRGRAVTVSHQTPPFAPAGLYDELRDLHALIHEYQQLEEGPVRDATGERIIRAVTAASIQRDMGWEDAALRSDFTNFLPLLHDHLHRLAAQAMPLGLHVFGQSPAPEQRLSTVMQQLGSDFYKLLGHEPDEFFAVEAEALKRSPPYALLGRHLREGEPLAAIGDPALRATVERGATLDRHLAENHEIPALLAGLAGGFVLPGPGGDPVRKPDVPNGRNLFPFEPDKIPTQAAFEAGEKALRQLVETYRASHGGQAPNKLAFSLWSSETMRHLGVLEAQVLHALGLRPVWDAGGRVTALEIVPAAELGRPRIDVMLQVTSVYRDQFDGFMRLLAEAIDRLAALDEPGNPVFTNSRAVAAGLVAQGREPAEAARLASLRIFSGEPGDYGTGLPEAVLASASWNKDDALASGFLKRMQYGYGASDWGVKVKGANLLAEQLRGVEAAVLSRSSTLHGLLSTDHPFEFLGGLSLAVRHLTGRSPSLYVSDLRQPEARVTGTAAFLSDEMRTRYLNPHWIGGMKQEGYAGTLEIVNAVNNLWGWQVTDPASVRADQWQAVHDTFVRDARKLDLARWFEQSNPTAQGQLIERLVEAIRKGYWDASEQTRRELAERWRELAEQHGVAIGAQPTKDFVATLASGFGVSAQPPAASTPPESASLPPSGQAETVSGQMMTPVPQPRDAEPDWRRWLGAALVLLCLLGGAVSQSLANRSRNATGAAS
ncbi:cobaltochelatase CobN [Bosea sp. CRIB-10]|uniref:cobaltochelatase subunit CobN n=1 Tax=Bosea sp. CRIB-10 TaxID=378404 RepID=UPI0008F43009|nr:cobaltochelatase subunit CobN [Bosea sp. CRIB-10]SFC26234.1 cobaltochelatase CobN [Bosea sp. CRIB-10]